MYPRSWVRCWICGVTCPDAPIRKAHHMLNHGLMTLDEFEAFAARERSTEETE